MLKLGTPKSMKETIGEHLLKADRLVTYLNGRSLSRIDTSDEGYDVVMHLRSGDIPVRVRDVLDIGIVGTDWIKEKRLEFGLQLPELDSYSYGREFFTKPRLELVVQGEEKADSTESLAPGVVSGETPFLMREYFEEHGWRDRVVQLGINGAPSDPKEFRKFCIEKGFMGMNIVHGTISELVNIGAGYGFMVSETDRTKEENGLKTIDVIMDVKMILIADPDALRDERLGPEIEGFYKDMRRAYEEHFDPESLARRTSEARVPQFLAKEK